MSKPVEFRDLAPDEVARLRGLFKEDFDEMTRFGEPGYLLPGRYKEHADAVRAMTVRPDDVWLMTFPRSGTHMTAELVWLLLNDLDYKKAREIPQFHRSPFIEIFSLQQGDGPIGYKILENSPSPRIITTHLAFSLLPPSLLDTGRGIFVARDPRDVVVSYFYFYKNLKHFGRFETLKQFWEMFIEDFVIFTPYFALLKEAWAQRNHPNMLFIFYEDIIKDMPAAIRKVSRFVGKNYSEDEVAKLSTHMDIDNMRNNPSVQPKIIDLVFVRQGKAGGWRELFDEEMRAQADEWMQRNLAGTGLVFPQHP